MDLSVDRDALAPAYAALVARTEPFLVSYPSNWPELDLAPFGLAIPEARRYTATSLRSRTLVDGLHALDAATFGGQEMLMPRWVLFDCGELPGIVFGLGRRAVELPEPVRRHYGLRGSAHDETFVPLSMWVAIRCAEPGAWLGHNLSSANLLLAGEGALPGLATLTKVLGVKLTRARRQYGATQWSSRSIGLHLRLGPMELLCAYTPAHTHPETFAYRIEVSDEALLASLRPGWHAPEPAGERVLDADDAGGIRRLHDDIERGERWQLVAAERREGTAQRLHLRRIG
jgi:hypothetical protein